MSRPQRPVRPTRFVTFTHEIDGTTYAVRAWPDGHGVNWDATPEASGAAADAIEERAIAEVLADTSRRASAPLPTSAPRRAERPDPDDVRDSREEIARDRKAMGW